MFKLGHSLIKGDEITCGNCHRTVWILKRSIMKGALLKLRDLDPHQDMEDIKKKPEEEGIARCPNCYHPLATVGDGRIHVLHRMEKRVKLNG